MSNFEQPTPCVWCGLENPANSRFCIHCGRFRLIEAVCPACNAPNIEVDQRFCGECGNPLTQQTDTPTPITPPPATSQDIPAESAPSQSPPPVETPTTTSQEDAQTIPEEEITPEPEKDAPSPDISCVNCGRPRPHPEDRFCDQCGNPFDQDDQPPSHTPEKNVDEKDSDKKDGRSAETATTQSVASVPIQSRITSWVSDIDILAPPRALASQIAYSFNTTARYITLGDRLIIIDFRVEIILLSLILAIASWLRIANLGDSPTGIMVSELNYGMEALRIVGGDLIGKWSGLASGTPSGHVHWLALLFWLNGGDASTVLLRIASAIPSIGTVLIGYLLVRRFFGVPTALISATMFSFSFFLVVQSRLGLPMVLTVFMLMLSMQLLVMATDRRNWIIGAVAGLTFGIGIFSFKEYMLYFFIIWIITALVMLFKRMWQRWEIVAFLIASVVAAYPILQIYLGSSYLTDTLRYQYGFDFASALSDPFRYVSNVWRMFQFSYDPLPNYYIATDGVRAMSILFGIFRIIFWIGFLTVILSLKQRPYRLLLIAWIIAAVPTLLVQGNESSRYLIGFFFVLTIGAIGIRTVLAPIVVYVRLNLREIPLGKKWKQYAITSIAIVLVALLVSFFASNERDRYNDWEHGEALYRFHTDLTRSIRFLSNFESPPDIRFYSARHTWNDNGIRSFLAPDLDGIDGKEELVSGGDAPTYGGPIERETVYILMDDYFSLLNQIIETHPSGEVQEHFLPGTNNKATAFVSYTVSPQ